MTPAATAGIASLREATLATMRCQEQWFVAYTTANHERRVAAHLAARSIEYFLPLYRSLRRWRDRRVQLELPLFPGYVFVRFASRAQLRVLETPGVVRLIGFNGQPYPLGDQEIESLRVGVQNAMKVRPHPFLNAGSRVRIVRGPLRGVEGVLARKKNVCRVVISLSLIGRSAAVEVDAVDVERIS